MTYMPPAGVIGHKVAELFGVDPRQAMQDDLIETRKLFLKSIELPADESAAGSGSAQEQISS